MEVLIHAIDPLGAPVMIGEGLCNEAGIVKDVPELKAEIIQIIEHPALLIEVFETPLKRYYFRAIDWNHTVLLGAYEEDGVWNIKEYFENPSGSSMLDIFKRGTQII